MIGKKKIKKTIFMVMVMFLILFIKTEAKATDEIPDKISLTPKINTIEENVKIPIEIYVKNNFECLDTLIQVNTEYFNELTEDDFEMNIDAYMFEYSEEDKNLRIILDNPIEEGVIATIYVTPKKTIKNEGTSRRIVLLKLYDMYIINGDKSTEDIYELESAIYSIGNDDNFYLESKSYNIGKNNIYEEGDIYISNISDKTSLGDFLTNIETNGTIEILKLNGDKLNSNEYVGTGMTLKVTKDEEEVILKIAVIGDLDGNGKVTITDLSELNKSIIGTKKFQAEYAIAADLNKDNKLSITDLSMLNKILLK